MVMYMVLYTKRKNWVAALVGLCGQSDCGVRRGIL